MPLKRLAGHTAEQVGFSCLHLTRSSLNMSTPEDLCTILRMGLKADVASEYEGMALNLLEKVNRASNAGFDESCSLLK